MFLSEYIIIKHDCTANALNAFFLRLSQMPLCALFLVHIIQYVSEYYMQCMHALCRCIQPVLAVCWPHFVRCASSLGG